MLKFDDPTALNRLFVPLVGYGSLVILGILAAINPAGHINFIFYTGIFILVCEFLALHSSVMLAGTRRGGYSTKFFLLGVYGILVVSFSIATQSVIIGIVFLVSLISKAFFNRASGKEASLTEGITLISIVVFLVTIFMSVVLTPILAFLIPISDAVMQHKDPNSSGLFVDYPQGLIFWVIVYYSALIVLYFVSARNTQKSAAVLQNHN